MDGLGSACGSHPRSTQAWVDMPIESVASVRDSRSGSFGRMLSLAAFARRDAKPTRRTSAATVHTSNLGADLCDSASSSSCRGEDRDASRLVKMRRCVAHTSCHSPRYGYYHSSEQVCMGIVAVFRSPRIGSNIASRTCVKLASGAPCVHKRPTQLLVHLPRPGSSAVFLKAWSCACR